jgi:hypothetical protein
MFMFVKFEVSFKYKNIRKNLYQTILKTLQIGTLLNDSALTAEAI